jgi:hypothetical protein
MLSKASFLNIRQKKKLAGVIERAIHQPEGCPYT